VGGEEKIQLRTQEKEKGASIQKKDRGKERKRSRTRVKEKTGRSKVLRNSEGNLE